MSKKKQYELLREKLSINQTDLANYLGISRSMVNMHERGDRTLSREGLLKLAEMEIILNKRTQKKGRIINESALAPAIREQVEKTKKELDHHIATAKYRLTKFKRELTTMEEVHQTLTARMHVIDYLSKEEFQNKASQGDQLWLQVQRIKVIEKIKRFGSLPLEKLKLKIKCLESEVENYTVTLKNLN